MSNILIIILLAIGSYLLGNVNWAVIISRKKKLNIKKMGSGNPGTLNMSRNLGLKFGILTFFLDVLKGVIPTLVAYFVLKGKFLYETEFPAFEFAIYVCGLFAVLGHIYPFWMKFRGGKGIATTIGVFIVCESVHGWQWSLIIIMSLIAAVMFMYWTEFGAMGSFIAITPSAVTGSIRLYLGFSETQNNVCLAFYIITNMIILLICFFTWFAHRKNIERMLAGEEHPTSIREMVAMKKAKKLNAETEMENKDTNAKTK